MKEIRVYDFIQQLRKKGVWVGISGSCEWWNTRADYETIYNYILTHHPERKYGYLSETANSLSNKRLGGGGKYILDRENVKWAIRAMEETIYV